MRKMANKAIKVKQTTPETAQLEAFIQTLGISKDKTKAELYIYNSLAYINADILWPLLSVEESWFVKNAEHPIHYIRIKKTVFVNKYGLTKVIAHSKEAVAFKLQDYIYEVIYKLETNGTVSKEELITRTALLDEIAILKSADEYNRANYATMSDEFKQLQIDHSLLEIQYQKIEADNIELNAKVQALERENAQLQTAAKQLAKYVKIKARKPQTLQTLTKIVEESNIDDDSDDEDNIDDDVEDNKIDKDKKTTRRKINTAIIHNAQEAKKQLKACGTLQQRKEKQQTNKKVLLRSADTVYNPFQPDEITFTWSIVKDMPKDTIEVPYSSNKLLTFKQYSQEVLLTGILQENAPEFIWYRDIEITDNAEKLFHFITLQFAAMSEYVMRTFIDLLELQ